MKLNSVQILRGLAAFLVLFFHIISIEVTQATAAGNVEDVWLSGIWNNGYAGVDLFFVISGFIMVYVTGMAKPGPATSGAFLLARAVRIYPLWWIFATILAIYMYYAHVVLDIEGRGWEAIGQGIPPGEYTLKSFLLLPQAKHPILGVGWTLVHEMFFYVAFAVLLLFPRKFFTFLIPIWGLLTLAGGLMGMSSPLASTIVQLVTSPMTLEFIMGAIVGLAIEKRLIWRPALIAFIGTLWMLAALMLFININPAFTLLFGRVMVFGPPAALIIYGCAGLDIVDRRDALVPVIVFAVAATTVFQFIFVEPPAPMETRAIPTLIALVAGCVVMGLTTAFKTPLSNVFSPMVRTIDRFLIALGDWSFGLYLSHMLVLLALVQINPRIANIAETHLGVPTNVANIMRLGQPGLLDNIAFMVIGTLACIIFSALSYRIIEKPLIGIFAKVRYRVFPIASKGLKPLPQ